MGKVGNIVFKGIKVGAHALAGCAAYGAVAAISNFHPSGTVGLVWNTVGLGLATGAVGAVVRWAAWDPTKARP